MARLTKLTLNAKALEKLPYIALASKIFFLTSEGKTSFLYSKHGMGFSNNLVQLMDKLKSGSILRIWFDIGLSGHIEIFVDKILPEGYFESSDEITIKKFEKTLGNA